MTYSFSDINDITGFANGDRFTSEEEIRAYFTVEEMRRCFSGTSDELPTQAELERMADTVINNLWNCGFLTDSMKSEIVTAAKKAAQLFVEEFGEAIDSEATDWDAEAWNDDSKNILDRQTDKEAYQLAWALYQETLQAETERLANEQ